MGTTVVRLRPPRPHRRVKHQIRVRSDLDRRRNAVKIFDRLVKAITEDVGDGQELSTIQHSLIQAFAGQYLLLEDLHCRLMDGENVDELASAAIVTSMIRCASRLGLARLRDQKPKVDEDEESLSDYLAANYGTERDAPADAHLGISQDAAVADGTTLETVTSEPAPESVGNAYALSEDVA
jgi:hypothetical protein